MLEMTLMSDDVNIKQAAIDILTILVEFSPSVIREYILQQSTDTGKMISKPIKNIHKMNSLNDF